MEAAKILPISELLQRSRPLTGASSLHFPPSVPSISRTSSSAKRKFQSTDKTLTSSNSGNASFSDQNPNPNPNPNPKVLASMNHPTIIIGTLNLPVYNDDASTSTSIYFCPKNDCLSFSDGSSMVCCAVLDLDVKIIGKEIHVLAWNFIPFKCGSGFLEIIRWSLPGSTDKIGEFATVDAFPLVSGSSVREEQFQARSSVHGRLESVSPVSVVPCAVRSRTPQSNSGQDSSSPRNLSGFLAEIMVCECNLCRSKASVTALHNPNQGQNHHDFTQHVSVYFFGSASSWRAVISKLIGYVVSLTGLKKKLVFIGKEESYLMFVTTEKSVLHLPRLSMGGLPLGRTVIVGRGESGGYTGIVTGVYMQGMVVELDEKVWLSLTDRLLALPHSLRVGALISLRNVHFVHLKFSWTRILLLGACFKTSISVKSFSPLEFRCHIRSLTQSLLGKFIESLAFSARLWVLLVVSCFRKKFAGIFSEKEILGSKHSQGVNRRKDWLRSILAHAYLHQHGLFMEFCKHDACSCGDEPSYGHLKLVVPISNFISHCEAMWVNMLVQLQNDSGKMGVNSHFSLLSCDGKSYGLFIRRIIPSEDIGVVLMGTLQISPSSGRLQLIDASGSIEVVIPDLPSNWNVNSIYEVQDYNLVIEGLPSQVDPSIVLKTEPFSCRSIFHHVPLARDTHPFTVYVHFYLRDATCQNVPLCLSSCIDRSSNSEELKSGTFHLLLVTHKFPVIQKFQGDSAISSRSSLFAEAIIMIWDLFLPGEKGRTLPTEVSKEKLKEHCKHNVSRNYPENLCSKRSKIAHPPGTVLTSGSMDNSGDTGKKSYGHLSENFSPHCGFSSDLKSSNLSSPLEMPCLVTMKSFNDHKSLRSGILQCKNPIVRDGGGCKPSARKILLEFKPESLFKYQLLRIGGYYIMQHSKEEFLCNLKDYKHINCGKALITSKMHLWSMSFSCDEVLPLTEPSQDCPSDVSPTRKDVVLSEGYHQSELLFQRSPIQCPKACSDVHFHLSVDAMNFLKIDAKALEEGMIRPGMIPGVSVDVSTCIGTMMTAPAQSFGAVDPECTLPEGNLISLQGDVVFFHSFDGNCLNTHLSCETFGDIHQLRLFQGVITSVCIHVTIDHHIVKIHGVLSREAYPIGMGPGVNATFHRVLVMGQHELMLTPVSFIVINSIKEVNHHFSDRNFYPWSGADICNDALMDTVSSGLISEIIQCLESKPMQFHCRVVAINMLLLEKHNRKSEKLQTRVQSQTPVVHIPLAGFVLDDGSSLCCCWTNAERAATLLRLHEEIPHKDFGNGCRRLKGTGIDNAHGTTFYHLGKILKNHSRIIVKNYGSMFDSSCQDISSVSSDNAISSSEEDFLKFIILNACGGSVLSVVGSVMDSNAIGWLEKELTEMEITMQPMQNIWVSEVRYMNPLAEARNMIQELLIRQQLLFVN
ncbi:hypothetical protein HHK36_009830 [Tetracentron sinense]|uniref:CST complex subunit CTC1 n=1 Tax=Tetracentron sinense TaxID=13715 RepID=A0A834ZGF4_TETSI|nr:hypothetical protein HHK36_009830 [Tetracentron sinense]